MLALLAALLVEPVRLLLSLSPIARFLPRTDHFAPHPAVPFEGYYTRIVTSTNATILVILSSVRHAPTKPHYVHFSHTPSGATPDLRIDVFPAAIHDVPGRRCRRSGFCEFTRVADGLGHCHTTERVQTYSLRLPDPDTDGLVEVDITLTHRTPWHAADPLSTPEGVFAHLTRLLPLHWNVFSHRSTAQYTIRRGGHPVVSGTGTAHVEKNWGASFPRGWTWMQAISDNASLCLAGGTILRQKAFLIGYRSRARSCSFAPPSTLLPFELPTPFLAVAHDSRNGSLGLTAHNLLRTVKLVVDVAAPSDHERWIPLACPLPHGHDGVFAYETFEASVGVAVWERPWPWAAWVLGETASFEGAALEFGGEYSFLVRGGGETEMDR